MDTNPNSEQADYWASDAGAKWIENETALDAAFAEVTARMLAQADPQPGQNVLDVGCGTGETSVQLAQRVGPQGRVTALDIAGPLLDRAEERARVAGITNITFRNADAQTADLSAEFDHVTSRFGVMFFADPVAAFGNLRGALKPGGRLTMMCWAKMKENPWFAIPAAAAVAQLGKPEPIPPRTPGPMAFAERDYAEGILSDAGWQEVRSAAVDLALTPLGGVSGAANLAGRVGVAVRVVNEKGGTEADMAAIIEGAARGFATYDGPDGLRVPARINLFTARA